MGALPGPCGSETLAVTSGRQRPGSCPARPGPARRLTAPRAAVYLCQFRQTTTMLRPTTRPLSVRRTLSSTAPASLGPGRALARLDSLVGLAARAPGSAHSKSRSSIAPHGICPRSSQNLFLEALLTGPWKGSTGARWLHSTPRTSVETVKVPQMAESISEGTLKQWLKKSGDFVKADEEVATIETDKIDVSVNAPVSGTVVETLANEEDTVTVGQDLFRMEPGDSASSGREDRPSAAAADAPAPSKDEAHAQQRAHSVDEKPAPKQDPPSSSSQVASASDRKRWSEVEVEKKEDQPSRAEPKVTESKQPQGRADYTDKVSSENQSGGKKIALFDRTERRVKMNRMRTRISERLKQSQNTAASLTTFNEIDMSSLIEMRKLYKDEILKQQGVKLGFMSAFAKAACLALREVPVVNAAIEGPGAGETIVYHDYVDLSVAVATPKGLVTPVIRNAESLNFVEIEEQIADLGIKARDSKLSLEDMTGGTFTISNGGVFGSLYGTPIINLPQSAVLGMHTIKDTPVVRNGQIVIRPIMIVALTYDHRLIDGREAVTFLVKIKQYIEDPRKMLLV